MSAFYEIKIKFLKCTIPNMYKRCQTLGLSSLAATASLPAVSVDPRKDPLNYLI